MKNTSFSQTQTFSSCQTKWFIGSVMKIYTPQSESAILGDHFHRMMENWVVGKEIDSYLSKYPTLKRIYKNNQEWFDDMASLKNIKTEHIEHKINWLLDCGINLFMKCDLIEGDSIKKEILSDYKSMSSFNYALDEEKLKNDPQMNLYAHFINKERKEQGNKNLITTLRHYQVNTRDCSIRTVEAPFSPKIGIETENKINAYTIAMLSVEKQKLEYVTKNRASCSDYGGCPYLEFCNKKETEKQLRERLTNKLTATDDDSTPEAKLNELRKELNLKLGGKKMGFADRLKNMGKAQDTQQTKFTSAKPKQAEVEIEVDEDEVDEDAISEMKTETKPIKKGFGSKKVEVEETEEDEVEEVKPVKKGKSFSKKVEVEEDEDGDGNEDSAIGEMPEEEGNEPVITPKKKSKEVGTNLNTMKSLVFVGCMPCGEQVVQPSIALHDQFVKPILKKEKLNMLCESKYNEAGKKLLGYAEEIKSLLYGKPFIYIDTLRVVDQTVLDMLLEDDTGRFIIVRKVF